MDLLEVEEDVEGDEEEDEGDEGSEEQDEPDDRPSDGCFLLCRQLLQKGQTLGVVRPVPIDP